MGFGNIISLLGGVALFLFGMSLMGSGLKKVAGDRLELVLFKMSNTPLKGILLGTGVTAVIQSSAATSVMVVGFVNSGMMKLKQAISIIMGSIIGTSITAWVICLSSVSGTGALSEILSTETLSGVVAVIGIILWMFAKKKSYKNLGEILLGFSVLMYGMKNMSDSVAVLKTNPEFLKIMTDFSNPFIGVLFGIIFTAILQSASASVGILQALSSTGVISFSAALPIIMGIAIGASVPVLLSAIGASANGKRTAYSYLIVDTVGVAICGGLFYIINAFVSFSFMDTILNSVGIATVNSVMRLVMIIILAPFVGILEKIATGLVKEKPTAEVVDKDLAMLDERFIKHPPLAVEQTRLTMNSMASKTLEAIRLAIGLLGNYNETDFNEVLRLEDAIDGYEDKLGSYLMKLTGRDLTEAQNRKVGEFLRTLSDFERISAHSRNIAESAKELKDKGIHFTDEGTAELGVLTRAVMDVVSTSIEAFRRNSTEQAYYVEPLEQVIDESIIILGEHHVARMQAGKCTFRHGYVFNDLLSDMERVSDHCSNIAAAVIETENAELGTHEYTDRVARTREHGFDENLVAFREKYKI